MHRDKGGVLIAVGLLLGMLTGCTQDRLSIEAHQSFQWFDTLGLPDVKVRPCVRVFLEWPDYVSVEREFVAFLLDEQEATFKVLTLGLFTPTYNRHSTEEWPYTSRFDVIDLSSAATECLALLRNPPQDMWWRHGKRLSERAEAFVLAWACWRNGMNAEAQALYDQAASMGRHGLCPSEDEPKAFRSRLQEDLACRAMWLAVEDFGNGSVSRKELLEQFQYIVEHFPDSSYLDRAADTVRILKRMVAEDEARAEHPPRPLEEMSTQDRVAELIFQLRDQGGFQLDQPGSCDIFVLGNDSPAHQLVAIGHDAIPQLIEARDDDSFTRAVEFWRYFIFSHRVLRVRDCAERILSRIRRGE